MKIAHFNDRKKTGVLQLEGFYVMEDDNARELAALGACVLAEGEPGEARKLDPARDWNGKRILFTRSGGMGDLLFLTPVIADIKERWPGARVDVCCLPAHAPVLYENPNIDRILSYPPKLEVFRGYDAHVWLDGFIEGEELARITPACRMAARRAGLDDPYRYRFARPLYYQRREEIDGARELYPRGEARRAGIQVFASAPNRTWPAGHVCQLVRRLLERGWEVFLFGAPGSIESDSGPNLWNLTQRKPKAPDIRESAAILGTCDVVVAPDSVICHLAGALDIATVALYGPFPWQVRVPCGGRLQALNGHGYCAPCFYHPKAGDAPFPAYGPCAKSGQCDVLGTITPERVLTKMERIVDEQQRAGTAAAGA